MLIDPMELRHLKSYSPVVVNEDITCGCSIPSNDFEVIVQVYYVI